MVGAGGGDGAGSDVGSVALAAGEVAGLPVASPAVVAEATVGGEGSKAHPLTRVDRVNTANTDLVIALAVTRRIRPSFQPDGFEQGYRRIVVVSAAHES